MASVSLAQIHCQYGNSSFVQKFTMPEDDSPKRMYRRELLPRGHIAAIGWYGICSRLRDLFACQSVCRASYVCDRTV
jgi:hypothetical protein